LDHILHGVLDHMPILTSEQLDIPLKANPCGIASADLATRSNLAALVVAGLLRRDSEGIHRLTEDGHHRARIEMTLDPPGKRSSAMD
jgi:hypothetical protein